MSALRWLALTVLVLAFTGSARSDSEGLAYASIAADVGSTLYALDRGEQEANPIYGSNPSDGAILIGGAVRVLGVYMIARSGYEHADAILDVISCVTFAVAGNNMAVADDWARGGGIMIGLSIPLFAKGVGL